MFAGKRPKNLGYDSGRLAPCKTSPNCVSSQADPKDEQHYIAPIALKGERHRRGAQGGRVDAAARAWCRSSPATSTPSSAAS